MRPAPTFVETSLCDRRQLAQRQTTCLAPMLCTKMRPTSWRAARRCLGRERACGGCVGSFSRGMKRALLVPLLVLALVVLVVSSQAMPSQAKPREPLVTRLPSDVPHVTLNLFCASAFTAFRIKSSRPYYFCYTPSLYQPSFEMATMGTRGIAAPRPRVKTAINPHPA